MTPMPRGLILVSLVSTACLFSCAVGVEDRRDPAPKDTHSGVSAAPAAATKSPKPEDTAGSAAKIANAERALELARAKLEKASADVASQEVASKEQMTAAQTDLELAQKALENFDANTSKARLEKAKLDFAGAQDSLTEAEEELQQLELMYEKAELADKTKELVLARGKRRIARSQRSLALQKQSLESLQNIEFPLERAKLQSDLDAKTRALAKVTRETSSGQMDKRLALQTQQNEVAKLEEELAAARRANTKTAESGK